MNRLNSLALFVVLLSGLIYGVMQWRSATLTEDNTIVDERKPDFIAEKLKSSIYSELGELSHTIEAERMEHYADIAVSYFELPNYTLYPKQKGEPWKVSALEATLQKDNQVELNKQVTIQTTEVDGLIKEIRCKKIALDLKTNIINSEQAVVVIGKDFTMYGSGLIIDLNTKQMTLTQHERTTYKKQNDS